VFFEVFKLFGKHLCIDARDVAFELFESFGALHQRIDDRELPLAGDHVDCFDDRAAIIVLAFQRQYTRGDSGGLYAHGYGNLCCQKYNNGGDFLSGMGSLSAGYVGLRVLLPGLKTDNGNIRIFGERYSMLMNILVVEDEQKVAAFLRNGLEEQGHSVDVAYDGLMGEKLALQKDYHVILLDVILPLANGLDVCRRIREVKPSVPILMLTALGTTDDKVTGFDAGADDYLVKPFEFKELLARIKALGKRTIPASAVEDKLKTLRVGDLQLDLDKKVAIREGNVIQLTAKEFALLEFLMRNKGRVLSRPEIAERVWEVTFDTGTNVVEVYMNILRKKIDKDFAKRLIHTRIGLGYVMQEEA